MLDEGVVKGSDICIFDMTERVGGRLMSLRGLGPDGDLTVDAGGYRTVSILEGGISKSPTFSRFRMARLTHRASDFCLCTIVS